MSLFLGAIYKKVSHEKEGPTPRPWALGVGTGPLYGVAVGRFVFLRAS